MTPIPASTAPTHTSPPRLHHLDALRGSALLLGVLLHALMPYGAGISWLVDDTRSAEWPLMIVYVVHLFRMVLFMMLAGFFGRLVLHRRGTGAYVQDRLQRIGLPFVAFWPVVTALTVGAVIANIALRDLDQSGTEASPAASSGGPGLLALPTVHLWFLLLLLEIVLVVVVARGLLRRVLGTERAGRASRAIGAALSSPAGLLLAAVPYAAALLIQGSAAGGIIEPYTFMPVAGASLAYTGAFLTGWFLHARDGALPRLQQQWIIQLVIAVVLTGVGLLAQPLMSLPVTAVVMALSGWAWVYGLLGLTALLVRRAVPVVRYLADASYWIYLWHFPLLLLVAIPLAELDWPIPVKLVISLVAVVGVLLVTYDLLVRPTWVGKWINGHRRQRVLLRPRREAQPLTPPAAAKPRPRVRPRKRYSTTTGRE